MTNITRNIHFCRRFGKRKYEGRKCFSIGRISLLRNIPKFGACRQMKYSYQHIRFQFDEKYNVSEDNYGFVAKNPTGQSLAMEVYDFPWRTCTGRCVYVKNIFIYKKSILHIPCRMISFKIKRFEIIPIIFYLSAQL